jgi:hypothetical protein
MTEQEKLQKAFDQDESETNLELKKGFFYVVNPQGKIIDCAKIYTFQHEKNIYKRIIAKVSKDVDDRIN